MQLGFYRLHRAWRSKHSESKILAKIISILFLPFFYPFLCVLRYNILMKKFLVLVLIVLVGSSVFAKKKEKKALVEEKNYDLALSDDDIFVLGEDENHLVKDGNGVHLFVKKRGDIQSVALLVQSNNYNDPDLSLMRAKEFNSVNGNEIRYSYGSKSTFRMERLPNALISSTVEDTVFGECFHIYVPKKMYYGYVIQVQNECEFEDGMTVNVRAFAEKYCDIGGKFSDNFLALNVSDWNREEKFAEIASETGGQVTHIESVSELTQALLSEIDGLDSTERIELVFAIDATDSMKDDFAELRKNWLPRFEKQMKKFKNAKIGLLFYKDYGDEFSTKGLPVKNLGFLKDAKPFSKAVKNVSVKGGGDREEAVYEALFACATDFDWSEEAKKKIILVGDAAPHSKDGGKYTLEFESFSKNMTERHISVDCILISDSAENVSVMKSVEKSKTTDELIKSVDMIDAK